MKTSRRREPYEDFVRRAARENAPGGIVGLFLKQAWAEFALSCRRIDFRKSDNREAIRAYCAMTEVEFEGINARQEWSNWRTIPRNLRGELPSGPCRAIDLCSGVGHSTRVLAYYLSPGSMILGLEYNPKFVEAARRREYRRSDGAPADVRFRVQSVLEPFRDESGAALPDASFALVNSCGALGIHFGVGEIERLAVEIRRVLKMGGLATVDSGAQGVDAPRMSRIFEERGFLVRRHTKSCFVDRFTHICFRKT